MRQTNPLCTEAFRENSNSKKPRYHVTCATINFDQFRAAWKERGVGQLGLLGTSLTPYPSGESCDVTPRPTREVRCICRRVVLLLVIKFTTLGGDPDSEGQDGGRVGRGAGTGCGQELLRKRKAAAGWSGCQVIFMKDKVII
jgi:hypothetical protein